MFLYVFCIYMYVFIIYLYINVYTIFIFYDKNMQSKQQLISWHTVMGT